GNVTAADHIKQYDGSVVPIEDELADRIHASFVEAELLPSVEASDQLDGAALLERARESSDNWSTKVRDFLGLIASDEIELTEIADWLAENNPDLDAFATLVYDEVYLDHRPG